MLLRVSVVLICVVVLIISFRFLSVCAHDESPGEVVAPCYDSEKMDVGAQEVVLTNQVKPNAWPDGNMGVIRDGVTYTFIGAADGDPIKSVGTLGNPISEGWKRIPIRKMRDRYDYVAGGPIYKDPESGTLLLFYHAEKWVKDNWRVFYSLLGMAKSTDGGEVWTDLGEIITPSIRFDSSFQTTLDIGGGSFLVIDGYFYVYYKDQLQSGKVIHIAGARARVSDVVATAINGDTVSRWNKYYSGSWDEPGLGGRSSPLEVTNAFSSWGDVSYNAYLGKYIMVTSGSPWPATDLYLLESADGISWSGRVLIVDDNSQSMYVTIIGEGNIQRVTGKQFYIYYIHSKAAALGSRSRNRDGILARRLISLK